MPDPAALRVLLVDDEAPARRKLRRLVAAASGVAAVVEAEDGNAAVEAIARERPDLVFLDVQMPGLDGFGVIERVGPGRMPPVVFVTAYDVYAVKAFEVQALDYLLKPYDAARFEAAWRRARERVTRPAEHDLSARLAAIAEAIRPAPRFPTRFLVEEAERAFFVAACAIDWVEADRNYVTLHLGGASHQLRTTLAALAAQLDPDLFLRLNRSQIVRVDRIREMQPWFHGEYVVLLHDGTKLRWSRRFRPGVLPGASPAD